MFDIKIIRDNPADFDKGLARRGLEPLSAALIAIDAERRAIVTDLSNWQARRNEVSKDIGKIKSQGGDADALIAEVAELKKNIADGEAKEREVSEQLRSQLLSIPNLPHANTPDGDDEDANVLVRTEGDVPTFDFEVKEHFDLGADLGQMDFETAAKLSGSRFVLLSGALARLERALGQFMVDLHTSEHDYTEVQTPVLVKSEALVGTGQLPKFEEDLFKADDHWLIPTAEVTLTNMNRDSIVPTENLPLRYTALTQCFRAEAGSAGRDTRGMIRQHQFNKVELVSIVAPEQGEAELERKTGAAEEVLKRLGLPYRVMALCTGDIGFSAHKTYDLEVWLPGQNKYREISSCSLCGDFQARRMNMRHRAKDEKQTQFPFTLNGSGLAVGRTLVAVMENYQQADGSIRVPDALKPYMGGMTVIERK